MHASTKSQATTKRIDLKVSVRVLIDMRVLIMQSYRTALSVSLIHTYSRCEKTYETQNTRIRTLDEDGHGGFSRRQRGAERRLAFEVSMRSAA